MKCIATPECQSDLEFVRQERSSPGEDTYLAICIGCGRMYESNQEYPSIKQVRAVESEGIDHRILPRKSRTLAQTVMA